MKYNSARVSFFLATVEQKLPVMWSFHSPPSFIHQGTNMHAKTDTNQNATFFFFFLKRFSHRKVKAEWTEVNDAVNVGYRVQMKLNKIECGVFLQRSL